MKKNQFILPEYGVYMCGHSLGPMQLQVQTQVTQTIKDWSVHGVASWNKAHWIDLPYSVAAKIAPLIGALESEVVVSDSTSVNLFKVLMSAILLKQSRKIILTTEDNFPSNLYIAQGIAAFNNNILLKTVKPHELMEHIDENIAVLMLTHVNYRDASMYDMQEICKYAHKLGVLTVWDLSHSVGIVPLALDHIHADFAVGCTYKYLNGGPGSPSFVYVNKSHSSKVKSPIYGWMGHNQPFAFAQQYSSTGSSVYIGGTPYVLNLKALEGALQIFHQVPINDIHKKALGNSARLINALTNLGLSVLTPTSCNKGGHIGFIHERGYALSRALIDLGVVCDYREPGLIRLCINPLYLEKEDIEFCIKQITKSVEDALYLLPKYNQKLKVT